MSPSLPPPPRKSSASSASGHATPRYPTINPNSLALADPHHGQDDDQDLDQALANLLGQSHIQPQPHAHCKHHGRPLSITSVSSLGSGSYSSYNSTHSRRVSQAYLSPLSPTFSEPSTSSSSSNSASYFNLALQAATAAAATHPGNCTCPNHGSLEGNESLAPWKEEAEHEQDSHEAEGAMAMAASSLPSCTYCASVRSNSVCSGVSTTTQEEQPLGRRISLSGGLDSQPSLSSHSQDQDEAHLHHHLLHHQHSRHHHHHHRQSLQMFDNLRMATLKEQIPAEVRHRLSYHLDECWFVHFSPDGHFLASTGLDHSILLWQDVASPEPTIAKTIQFSRTVTHVEWSPDSRHLLVNLGFDGTRPGLAPEFNLIDIATGEIILARRHMEETRDVPVRAIGWMPDSQEFVTAPEDGNLCVWNLKGEMTREINMEGKSVLTLRMVPGQNQAVILTKDLSLELISLDGAVPARHIDRYLNKPCSIVISRNGSYLSASIETNADLCRPAQVLIYDFKNLSFIRAMEADSYINNRFVICPTFVGLEEEMICAGSENGKLHFWEIATGELITVVEEHSQHCGWVTTNPTQPGMMASCSDDNHIILWVTKNLSRDLQEEDEKWMEKRAVTMPRLDIKKGW